MTAIPTTMGNAGQGLGDAAGVPKLSDTLRDIADDLAGVQNATIAAPALLAFTDPPSAAEMALLRTLVNEIRTALIATGTATLKTTKAAY